MTTKTAYDIGDLVRCTGTFASSGANVNPSAVLFKVKTPAGTITTYTYGTDVALVRDSTGIYHVDVDATEAGEWTYRFWSTGTGQAAAEGQFIVKATLF